MPVTYSSVSLPSWLSWKDDVLSGIPSPDAESCDVTVEARFVQDGQEEVLSHTVHITISPMASVDTASFASSRRPSLVGDVNNPRRGLSDPLVQSSPPRASALRQAQGETLRTIQPVTAPTSQVVQVLTNAAQRVAQDVQNHVISEQPGSMALLAKQQHVLTVTADALTSSSTHAPDAISEIPMITPGQSLAVIAKGVVLQAARQAVTDRANAVACSIGQPVSALGPVAVTVEDVSMATQSAVATAVEMVGQFGSEVQIMSKAREVLVAQQEAADSAPPVNVAPSDPVRPHSTGAMLPPPFPSSFSHAPQPISISMTNGYYPH